jgi:hypothetical protein
LTIHSCSLQCFKTHKPIHESEDAINDAPKIKSEESTKPNSTIITKDGPGPKVNPYLALQSHPSFLPLFTKHPTLKTQLQRVYQACQNPYEDPGPRQRNRDRVQGQWTQDKADELAVKVLMDLRKQDEGVREFMELLGEVSEKRNEVEAGREDG